jgi:hypothetical protein
MSDPQTTRIEDKVLELCMRPVMPPAPTEAEVDAARTKVETAGWQWGPPDAMIEPDVGELIAQRRIVVIVSPGGAVYFCGPHEVSEVMSNAD